MSHEGVYVFPDAATGRAANSMDPALIALLSQNGGFGNGMAWMWPMFMYMMFPWLFGGFGGGFGGFGGFGGAANGMANGFGYLANQMNNDSNVNLLSQAIENKAEAITQLATILNTSVGNVQNGINALNAAIQNVGNTAGLSREQIINAVISGNANISSQIAQCCCDNRLAICEQTNTLQSQAAQNFAAQQLQDCQYNGEQRLAMSQQTNQILTSNQVNTQAVLDKISDQNVMITKQFCDLKEREYQSKINTMGDTITQLRGQISNDNQDKRFASAINALTERLIRIESHQPNTIPVQYPNVVAMNTTPYYNGGCGCNNGCGCNGQSYWG